MLLSGGNLIDSRRATVLNSVNELMFTLSLMGRCVIKDIIAIRNSILYQSAQFICELLAIIFFVLDVLGVCGSWQSKRRGRCSSRVYSGQAGKIPQNSRGIFSTEDSSFHELRKKIVLFYTFWLLYLPFYSAALSPSLSLLFYVLINSLFLLPVPNNLLPFPQSHLRKLVLQPYPTNSPLLCPALEGKKLYLAPATLRPETMWDIPSNYFLLHLPVSIIFHL